MKKVKGRNRVKQRKKGNQQRNTTDRSKYRKSNVASMKEEGVTERNANSGTQTRCVRITHKTNVNTEPTAEITIRKENAHSGHEATAKKGNTAI